MQSLWRQLRFWIWFCNKHWPVVSSVKAPTNFWESAEVYLAWVIVVAITLGFIVLIGIHFAQYHWANKIKNEAMQKSLVRISVSLDFLSRELNSIEHNGSFHKTTSVEFPANVLPIFQPDRSPEFNPIERLRRFILD